MQHILIASLGESPVVITAMYDLLTEQEKLPISKVIVLHPQEETIRYAVDLIQDALKDTCEVIQDIHQRNPYKIELALSGGRKGMAALAMFAAQRKGIRYVYHTLITDKDTSRKVDQETDLKKLTSPELSEKERNNRLFLRKYEGNGPYTKFVLFKVPVLPARG